MPMVDMPMVDEIRPVRNQAGGVVCDGRSDLGFGVGRSLFRLVRFASPAIIELAFSKFCSAARADRDRLPSVRVGLEWHDQRRVAASVRPESIGSMFRIGSPFVF